MRLERAAVSCGLLAAALLAGGLAASAAPADPWRELWGDGEDPTATKYEELFGQPYRPRPFDLFNRSRPFYEVQEFNRAFDLRVAGVSWRVDDVPDGVVLSIYWPGSAAEPLDVTVERGFVRARPSPAPQRNGAYRFYAADSRQVEVPIPEAARGESAKMSREADVIRVHFDRK